MTNFPSLQLLLQRELLEQVGDGYRFQVEMIRQWFAATDETDRLSVGRDNISVTSTAKSAASLGSSLLTHPA